MKSNTIPLIVLANLFVINPASGARFPNAVERKMVFTGKGVIPMAELLDLTAPHPSYNSYVLGKGDTWAVYLLKHDTKVELFNDNEGCPPRHNKIEYSSTPAPSLIMSPFWLDLGTQGPDPKPGYYSFSSPFLSEKLDQDDPWTRLVKRLIKDPDWHAGERIKYKRSFDFAEGKQLEIVVFENHNYETDKNGYSVGITARAK